MYALPVQAMILFSTLSSFVYRKEAQAFSFIKGPLALYVLYDNLLQDPYHS